MKTVVRFLSLFIFVTSVTLWIATGAHTGWSKNRIAIEKIDPITEIVYPVYQEKWILGVDLLVISIFCSLILLFLPNLIKIIK